ncbi:MAG: D-alanine--D-alanine ligase [Spirochaetaceae bacterium]|nr:D-alanine--D-alanine ligase [Spirochaetaceae bacterium]
MKNILLLMGGKSAEYEISLRSAATIYQNLDSSKYHVLAVAVNKETGQWYYHKDKIFNDDFSLISQGKAVYLALKDTKAGLYSNESNKLISYIDLAFPITHGPYGEDGKLQGFLSILNIPFVGPGVLSSAACMDKEVTKILLKDKSLKVARGKILIYGIHGGIDYDYLSHHYGETLFVKPARMGSSIGVSKVKNQAELDAALELAFKYDNKIIVEEALVGREIECAILGSSYSSNPSKQKEASIIGEIVGNGFYSYDEKYADNSQTQLIIPAKLTAKQLKMARNCAMVAYSALMCRGMARVDMFLVGDKVYVNEINTLPGFTSISMYPSLWAASGLPLPKLLDKLIDLAQA